MPKRKNKIRADGRFAVQIYLGIIDGKRKYKTVYGSTQKEADEKALQAKLQLQKGIDLTAERDTFGQWAERFLTAKASDGISHSQMQSYRNYRNHLSELNNIPIAKVRSGDIQSIIFRLAEGNEQKKGLSKKTLGQIRSTAKQIFQMAVDARVMDYNPAQATHIPHNAPEHHRDALTEEQQQWVIDTPHRAQRAAMLMMYAGLRRGEATALTWADIDLTNNTITINKSVEMIKGKPVIKDHTKTPSGMRTIHIPQILSDFLIKEKAQENPLCIYVLHTIKGNMLTNQAWRTLWSSYLKTLNEKYGNWKGKVSKFQPGGLPMKIPSFTPHWLRHTFATLLYLAGVDILTARDQLGHADIKTTLAIYTHLDKKYKRSNMGKLDEYLKIKKES